MNEIPTPSWLRKGKYCPQPLSLQLITTDNCSNPQVKQVNVRDYAELTQEDLLLRWKDLAHLLGAYGAHFHPYYCGSKHVPQINFSHLSQGEGHFTCENTRCLFNSPSK